MAGFAFGELAMNYVALFSGLHRLHREASVDFPRLYLPRQISVF